MSARSVNDRIGSETRRMRATRSSLVAVIKDRFCAVAGAAMVRCRTKQEQHSSIMTAAATKITARAPDSDRTERPAGRFSHQLTLTTRRALDMSAELIPHRGEKFVGEIGLAPGSEALEQGRRQDRRGRRFLDRRKNGPAAFARIGNMPRKF